MILTRPRFTVKDGADTLVENAVALTGAQTKRRVVNLALRRLIRRGSLVANLSLGLALALVLAVAPSYGAARERTRPTVSSTDPADGATGVAIDQSISATFSEAMNPSTLSNVTFTLKDGNRAVVGTVRCTGSTATFTPANDLAPNTAYTARIKPGVKDLAGNPQAANFVWSFTTAAATDTTRPTVISTVPADGATAVAINQTISATFSEAMDPLTISAASFLLTGPGGAPVMGTVAYDVGSRIATLTPATGLAPNAVYSATVTTGVTDLAGNALAANFIWSFATAATTDATRPSVSSTVPSNGAIGVPIGGNIATTFNEVMDPLTINTATFTLMEGATPVNGTVSYTGGNRDLQPIQHSCAQHPLYGHDHDRSQGPRRQCAGR